MLIDFPFNRRLGIAIKVKTNTNAQITIMKHVNSKEVVRALKLAKTNANPLVWKLAKASERIRFQAEFNAKWTGRVPELIEVMQANCEAKDPPTDLETVVKGAYTPRKENLAAAAANRRPRPSDDGEAEEAGASGAAGGSGAGRRVRRRAATQPM